MFNEITYYMIFGRPLIMYMGILTVSLLLFTAYIGYSNLHGNMKIPLKWHFVMAGISLVLALMHGLAGILAYI